MRCAVSRNDLRYLLSLGVPIIEEYKVATRIFKPLFSNLETVFSNLSFLLSMMIALSCFMYHYVETSGFFSVFGSLDFFSGNYCPFFFSSNESN
jgi:hypothetical protein